MSTNEIKALERRVAELEHQLDEAKNLLLEAKLEACPIKIGDVVIDSRRGGVEYKVTEVDVNWGDLSKPWIYGNPKKKDGTWGTARRALYSHWKLPAGGGDSQ